MICKRCNIESKPYRLVMRNGMKAVIDKCPSCGKSPDKDKIFLPLKDYDWFALPFFGDELIKGIRCGVTGCNNTDTELHHYAPRALFGHKEAENWQTGYLCKYHHKLWHDTINKK